MDDLVQLRAEIEGLRGHIADVAAIERLIFEHGYRYDAADFDGFADLFCEDAILQDFVNGAMVAEARGRDAIRGLAMSTQRLSDGSPATHHVFSGIVVEIDEPNRSARARSCITVMQAAPGFPLQAIACGTNTDAMCKERDGWRIVSRRGEVRLLGDLSRHVPTGFDHGA